MLRLYGTVPLGFANYPDPFHYQWLFVVVMPFGPILLDLQGFYQSPLNKTLWRSFVQILRAMIGLSIIVSGCVIFLRLPLLNRTVPLFFYRHRRFRVAGERTPCCALHSASRPTRRNARASAAGIVDRIDIGKRPVSELVEAMHRHAVSRVIFGAGHTQLNKVEQAIGACEVEGVPAWLVADFIQTWIAKPDFDAFAGRPMLVFCSTPEVSWALLVKAIIDRVCAFILLVIFAIPMLLIALAIRITSPGPVVFRQ